MGFFMDQYGKHTGGVSCLNSTFSFFVTDISPLRVPGYFNACLPLIPPARRERLLKFRREEDRCRSLAAGLLLKRGCEEYGIPGEDERLREGPQGKPAFQDCPDICFNLSHAGELVILAIGNTVCGCDTEKHQTEILKHAERLMTPPEYENYLRYGTSEAERARQFFRLWTGKESLMKCTGRGFSLPLKSFSLAVDPEGISLLTPVDEHRYTFFEYPVRENYGITLCLRDYDGEKPELIRVSQENRPPDSLDSHISLCYILCVFLSGGGPANPERRSLRISPLWTLTV